jgi:hypothetical protein
VNLVRAFPVVCVDRYVGVTYDSLAENLKAVIFHVCIRTNGKETGLNVMIELTPVAGRERISALELRIFLRVLRLVYSFLDLKCKKTPSGMEMASKGRITYHTM